MTVIWPMAPRDSSRSLTSPLAKLVRCAASIFLRLALLFVPLRKFQIESVDLIGA
jgi:hypothetical protein